MYQFWRVFSGIFLDNFSGHFSHKNEEKKSGEKKKEKIRGPRTKIREKTVLPKPDADKRTLVEMNILFGWILGWIFLLQTLQYPRARAHHETTTATKLRLLDVAIQPPGVGGQKGLARGNPSKTRDSGLFSIQFPYAPLGEGGHISGELFWLSLGVCFSPTPSRQPLFETSDQGGNSREMTTSPPGHY